MKRPNFISIDCLSTMPMYEDFCKDDEEIYQFELDMENRRYEKWVLRYPEHTLSIFGSLLTFNRNHVKAEDICYFVSAGVDLNKVISEIKFDL
jgi:hypothetical protein